MTTTAVVTATASADTSYTGSVTTGTPRTFGAVGLVGNEAIVFEQKDSSGSYSPIVTYNEYGKPIEAKLKHDRTLITLASTVDFRINKTATSASTEVVEYT